MDKNLSLEKIVFERIVFTIRLTSIGDVIIAMRSIALLKENGYFPVLITSSLTYEIALKSHYLVSFIIYDKLNKPRFFWNYIELNEYDFLYQLKNIQTKNRPFLLDLQGTSRSKKVEFFLQKKLFLKWEKKFSASKRVIFRFFLIFRTLFFIKQTEIKKKTSLNGLKRIHLIQENEIKKICLFDKKKFSSFNKDKKIKTLLSSSACLNKNYICLFPGASNFIKIWPKENMRELILSVLKETELFIFICGSKSEEYLGEYLSFPNNCRVINYVNHFALGETLEIIANAKYIVTNDSFAAHAADAFLVPASVIFGSTSPLFGFVPCYDEIKIEYLNLSCSPCTRHGKRECRYRNLMCLKNLRYSEILRRIKYFSR